MRRKIDIRTLSPEAMGTLLNDIVVACASLESLEDKALFFKRLQERYLGSKRRLLHHAVLCRDKVAITALLDLDIDKNELGAGGLLPIDFAKGDPEFATWLIQTHCFKPTPGFAPEFFWEYFSTLLLPLNLSNDCLLEAISNALPKTLPKTLSKVISFLIVQYAISDEDLEKEVSLQHPRNLFRDLYQRYRHPNSRKELESLRALTPLFTLESGSLGTSEKKVLQLLSNPEHQNKPYSVSLVRALFMIQKMEKKDCSTEYFFILENQIKVLEQERRKKLMLLWMKNALALTWGILLFTAGCVFYPVPILALIDVLGSLWAGILVLICSCCVMDLFLGPFIVLPVSFCDSTKLMRLWLNSIYKPPQSLQAGADFLLDKMAFLEASCKALSECSLRLNPDAPGFVAILFLLWLVWLGLTVAGTSPIIGTTMAVSASCLSVVGLANGAGVLARKTYGFFRPPVPPAKDDLDFSTADGLIDRMQNKDLAEP